MARHLPPEVKAMMIHHACPRCSGSLIPDDAAFACLQCGARVYQQAPVQSHRAQANVVTLRHPVLPAA